MYATKNQIKKIHTLKSVNNIEEKDYREALSTYGVGSSVKLLKWQASDFIKKLSKGSTVAEPVETKQRKSYRGYGNKGSQKHLTQIQAERIDLLEQLLKWDKNRLYGFIQRQTKQNKAVQMLMNYEAVKVIVGMQRIYSSSNKSIYKKINEMNNNQLRDYINERN